ncbi:MAG TPA: putative toxin-antitoxin system toxin component, PIN family [Spirochaetota bacterium]|nr:putative toxin-antitoxin system toxin component, PIN family [Spirochaetota bacterium]HNT09321.1 putative toxin-antitoxin system toxin component, PIN family [Spirochaetota bacterium]
MKVVLDTNVIISALVTHGISFRVLDLCIDHHSLYISEFIVNELCSTLSGKFRVPAKDIAKTKSFIDNVFANVHPQGALPSVCRDADDNNILLLAEFVSADLLVTGDKDLLSLQKYGNTSILSPRSFMDRYYRIQ